MCVQMIFKFLLAFLENLYGTWPVLSWDCDLLYLLQSFYYSSGCTKHTMPSVTNVILFETHIILRKTHHGDGAPLSINRST